MSEWITDESTGLQFYSGNHTYWYNGEQIKSVTQVLDKKFIPTDDLMQKAHDGSTVHWFCLEKLLRGESITVTAN